MKVSLRQAGAKVKPVVPEASRFSDYFGGSVEGMPFLCGLPFIHCGVLNCSLCVSDEQHNAVEQKTATQVGEAKKSAGSGVGSNNGPMDRQ